MSVHGVEQAQPNDQFLAERGCFVRIEVYVGKCQAFIILCHFGNTLLAGSD